MGVSTNEQRELKLNSEIEVSSFVLVVVLALENPVHKREQKPYPLYTRSGHGRSRKRAARRATPDRAGARPYH